MGFGSVVAVSARMPPDQPARHRIAEELDSTLLVEAGAGSGKTTALVDRMAALILRRKCTVDQIAAVTFTRKAAAELRQRLQDKLEKTADAGSGEREAANNALRDLDKAFVGTIHAFCARLLRQRPLDVGLDPDFREVMEHEAGRMQERAWGEFLERLAADGDPRLERLDRLGISPHRLKDAFCRMVEHPDVDFGGELSSAEQGRAGSRVANAALEAWFEHGATKDGLPARVAEVRKELETLLGRAATLMPATEPEKGWDRVALKVRALERWRRMHDWDEPRHFLEALATLYQRRLAVTQNRWSDTSQGKAAAKALGQQFTAFCAAGSDAAALLEAWWAHRYPVSMSVANDAARGFAAWRRQEGALMFSDLLVLAAEMLRENPDARRELGCRYRYVLVDEFQDTDPLQAEILFLLSSDPGSAGRRLSPSDPQRGDLDQEGADWTRAVPRRGALFVVGDPKQSIYRFRRADISLYQFVKKRFASFGEVLSLETNFRSRDKMGALIDGVFGGDGGFPSDGTDRQAAFAPLVPHRTDKPAVLKRYVVEGANHREMAKDDAARIAAEIDRRTNAGEHKLEPGDFMVLLRTRKHLAIYAAALEDRNLPVDVSGAGVGVQAEMAAFLLLFKCLADPSHAVLALAVLVGPFFGVALDQIVRFRDAGGSLAINRPPRLRPSPEGAEDDGIENDDRAQDFAGAGCEKAARALDTLHGWWELARKEPADVTAERLVRETGFFPLAAGSELGQLRAGALAYVLDAVRAAALAGDASLAGAVRAMEAALAWEDAEAPLVPARKKAVRVMNVHRAKGLEANVVFLAAPFGDKAHTPKMHVARGEDGVARGTIPIVEPGGRSFAPREVIARPLAWEADCKVEAAFDHAEKVRLLYVAATRARDELWVAKQASGNAGKKKNDSPWAPIEQWLEGESRAAPCRGEEGPLVACVSLLADEAGGPAQLDPGTDLSVSLEETRTRRARAGEMSHEVESVSAATKGTVPTKSTVRGVAEFGDVAASTPAVRVTRFKAPEQGSWPGGKDWGDLAHAVLAAAGSGIRGDALVAVAKSRTRERRLSSRANRDPADLDALLSLVHAVMASPLWRRAMDSTERYAEMPFARFEDAGPAVVKGAIDLVFRDRGAGSWVVVDYKTDGGGEPAFAQKVAQYRAQVDRYAECWEALVGEPVGERVLLFATQGRIESW